MESVELLAISYQRRSQGYQKPTTLGKHIFMARGQPLAGDSFLWFAEDKELTVENCFN